MINEWLKQLGIHMDTDEAIRRIRKALELPTPEATGRAPNLAIDEHGWLYGLNVTRIEIDRSWYYKKLDTVDGQPHAIVCHTSDTNWGTAENMAKRRQAHYVDGTDRPASWHVSIENDGRIVQMAPFIVGCWHAGGKTAKGIPGLGGANHCSVGIELIGMAKEFPEAQVESAKQLWRALVTKYPITRANAHWQHATIDPGRKVDPGPVWMRDHAVSVLDYAFKS